MPSLWKAMSCASSAGGGAYGRGTSAALDHPVVLPPLAVDFRLPFGVVWIARRAFFASGFDEDIGNDDDDDDNNDDDDDDDDDDDGEEKDE
jgi:phosphopantothenoylcysteine synthetase/decarboxylase